MSGPWTMPLKLLTAVSVKGPSPSKLASPMLLNGPVMAGGKPSAASVVPWAVKAKFPRRVLLVQARSSALAATEPSLHTIASTTRQLRSRKWYTSKILLRDELQSTLTPLFRFVALQSLRELSEFGFLPRGDSARSHIAALLILVVLMLAWPLFRSVIG